MEKEKIFGSGKKGANIAIVVIVGIGLLSLALIVSLLSLSWIYLWPLTVEYFSLNLTSLIFWPVGNKWLFAVLVILAVVFWRRLNPAEKINRRKDETLLFNAGIDRKKGEGENKTVKLLIRKKFDSLLESAPRVFLLGSLLGFIVASASEGWPRYFVSLLWFIFFLAFSSCDRPEKGNNMSRKS